MESYKNIINFSIIAVAVIIFVHLLFNSVDSSRDNRNTRNSPERFQMEPSIEERVPNAEDESINSDCSLGSLESTESVLGYDPDLLSNVNRFNDINGQEFDNAYPLREPEDKKYLEDLVIDKNETCQRPPKTRKQFNEEFFKFRDRTFHNSSMRYDAVDKIKDLYLSGNTSEARRYPNMKIKDLYNELTRGPSLYERQCVRAPLFDNLNPNGYQVSTGTPGTVLTGNQWNYNNERVMNGGEIERGLTGNN